MANYTTEANVMALYASPIAIQSAWLDWADALIEAKLGGGFKGAQRSKQKWGNNSNLIRLPSEAASVEYVVQTYGSKVTLANISGNALPYDAYLLPDTEYSLGDDGRSLLRVAMGLPPVYNAGYPSRLRWAEPIWAKLTCYSIFYTEPTQAPVAVVRCATELVATIAMFAVKNSKHGIAYSATASGNVSGAGQSFTMAFPKRLAEELDAIVEATFSKQGGLPVI